MLPKGFIVIEFSDQTGLEDRQDLLSSLRRSWGSTQVSMDQIKSITPVTEIGSPLSDQRVAQIQHVSKVTENPDLEDLLQERMRLMCANALIENSVRSKMKDIQRLESEVRSLKSQLAQLGVTPSDGSRNGS